MDKYLFLIAKILLRSPLQNLYKVGKFLIDPFATFVYHYFTFFTLVIQSIIFKPNKFTIYPNFFFPYNFHILYHKLQISYQQDLIMKLT